MSANDSEQHLSADSQPSGAPNNGAPQVLTTQKRAFRYPIVIDLVLTLGLLLVAGGFTVGLFQMYLLHAAEKSINDHNYKAAIGILRDSPIPEFLRFGAADTTELLNQALYLDAMDKIEQHTDMTLAVRQLKQIKPGSRYYHFAQETLSDIVIPPGNGKSGAVPTKDNTPHKFDPFEELKAQ